MKLRLAIIAVLVLLPSLALAKTGPEIPRPETPLPDAVRQVEAHFLNTVESEPRNSDFERFKRECIVLRTAYTDTYSDGSFEERPGDRDVKLGEWSWVVTIVHPRQNDHTWVFQLRRDGTITLLAHSI
jgi:hypothetical protein